MQSKAVTSFFFERGRGPKAPEVVLNGGTVYKEDPDKYSNKKAVPRFYKKYLHKKTENAIGCFFSTAALPWSGSTAAVVDTGDYATWIAVSVERRTETEDPPHWHNSLEEEDYVVPAEHHIAEWPLLAKNHVGDFVLRG
jgi:hypothetical protein